MRFGLPLVATRHRRRQTINTATKLEIKKPRR
jgi:hypothetical protein